MPKPKIKPVATNTEKAQVYKTMMTKYSIAVKSGFYCEAIMIDYAMIEDRLRSVLYHMGLLANRTATKVWKKTRPELLKLVEQYKDANEDSTLGIGNISGKIKIVRCLLLWAINTEDDCSDNKYLKALKSQLEGTDLELFLQTVNEVKDWTKERNEVVHAMLNKNVIALEEKLKPLAEEGMRLGRALDSQERLLKKGNKVRRSVNLSMN